MMSWLTKVTLYNPDNSTSKLCLGNKSVKSTMEIWNSNWWNLYSKNHQSWTLDHLCKKRQDINFFHAAGLFDTPLKHQKTRRFRWYRKRPVVWNGLMPCLLWKKKWHKNRKTQGRTNTYTLYIPTSKQNKCKVPSYGLSIHISIRHKDIQPLLLFLKTCFDIEVKLFVQIFSWQFIIRILLLMFHPLFL